MPHTFCAPADDHSEVKRFAVPTFAYVELPQQARLPVTVKEIRPTGLWLETQEALPVQFRANLRLVFPSTQGSLGFNVEVVCRGERGLGIELPKNTDAVTKAVLEAWSKGQAAEVPNTPPPAKCAHVEETEDLPRVAARDPFAAQVAAQVAASNDRSRPGIPLKHQLSGTSVLVIDDDVACAKYLQSGLGRLGGVVTVATDGIRGLDLVREKRVDAVLLDWMLPVMSGERVLNELRVAAPAIPVAVVSGVVQSGAMRARVRMLGASEVFAKPFELRQISDWLVRSVVASR